jgi:hypothetical protein
MGSATETRYETRATTATDGWPEGASSSWVGVLVADAKDESGRVSLHRIGMEGA